MENEVPPSSEQIKRLKALQGVDSGVFTLAVFSTLEGHMRYQLKDEVNNKTSFPDVLKTYRTYYSVGNPKEYMLFKNAETTLIKPRLWQFLSIMESIKTVKCDLSLIYTFLDISGFCVKY